MAIARANATRAAAGSVAASAGSATLAAGCRRSNAPRVFAGHFRARPNSRRQVSVSYASEADQIARAAAGDRQAQAALVHRHMPAVHALARRMLGSDAEAEDVTQETFLRAWKVLPDWEPRAKLSTWLYRVALNLSRDRLRRHRETAMAEPPELEDSRPGPGDRLDQTQRVHAIEAAMRALPERQRAALHLCALDGKSNIEAAEILQVSVEALESLLARARRTLRTTLQKGDRE